MANFLTNNYPNLSPNDTNAILAQYATPTNKPPPPLPNHAPWYPTASKAYGEATFVCPNNNVLNLLRTRRRFSYRYNVHDEGNTESGIGVPHLFEAAAVFGPDNIGHASPSYKTYNAPIVPVVMSYFISFVRALDPNVYRAKGKESPKWHPWDESGMERIVLETGRSRMERTPVDERVRCRFWLELGEVLEQ